MNPEINKKFREIQSKCNNKTPKHYPGYCHRAILDVLSLLSLITEELADKENAIEDLALVDDFIKMEDLLS